MLLLKTSITKKCAEKNISLSKLEALCGMGKNYIHTIFNKDDVQLSTLRKIAEVLQMEMWEFFYSTKPSGFGQEQTAHSELLKAYKRITDLQDELLQYKAIDTLLITEGKANYKTTKKKK